MEKMIKFSETQLSKFSEMENKGIFELAKWINDFTRYRLMKYHHNIDYLIFESISFDYFNRLLKIHKNEWHEQKNEKIKKQIEHKLMKFETIDEAHGTIDGFQMKQEKPFFAMDYMISNSIVLMANYTPQSKNKIESTLKDFCNTMKEIHQCLIEKRKIMGEVIC